MEELLVQYGTEIMGWLEEAVAFSKEQAPMFVQEVLRYGKFKAIVGLSSFSIFWGLAVASLIIGIKGIIRDVNWAFFAGALVLLGAFGQFLIIGVATSILNLLKISVAPRLYLIEILKGFFSG